MQHVVMVDPIDTHVDEAQEITDKDRGQRIGF